MLFEVLVVLGEHARRSPAAVPAAVTQASRLGRRAERLRPILAGSVLLCLAACDRPVRTPVERGAGIFQRSCAGCHGSAGRGGNTRLGLVPPPRDLTDPEFQEGVTDEVLRRSIRSGKGMMPAFGGLMPDEDLAALIAFIRSLSRGAQ